ncbi:MAG: ribonuclease HI family protein [Candidatus Bipolaricaulota bacterium]
MDKLFVYVDGGARGEPGDASIGIAITDPQGDTVEEISELIGRSTTDVAEYRALVEGARRAVALRPPAAVFFTDNQRLANYVNGVFETREPHVRHLVERAIGLLNQLPQWRVNYVDRRALGRAPRLVEQAFHRSVQAQMGRERMESTLLSRAATLSEEGLRKLIEAAERLQELE